MFKKNHSSMLELARRSCDDADPDYDPEGEFFPEDDGIKWGEAEQDYDGEYRYVNAGPQKLRHLAETESDPQEAEAIRLARQAWNSLNPSSGIEAGWIDRGEVREANCVQNLSECISETKAEFYGVVGSLEVGGIPTLDTGEGSRPLTGIIDVDALQAMGSFDETPSCDLDLELMDI